MPDDLTMLFDPSALALVVIGTLIATAARSGWHDVHETVRALSKLNRRGFDEDANRASLAQSILAIQRDGPLRAEVPMPPDPMLANLIDIYIRQRSLAAVHSAQRGARAARDIARMQAVRTMEHAGELGPVFGLVGTLFAITQLSPGDAAALDNTMSSIAAAAVSTLYGVLTAHMIFIPLARAIDRQGEREELRREELIDWLDDQLSNPAPTQSTTIRGVA